VPALSGPADLPDHVRRNRETWDDDARNWVDSGRRNWASEEPHWGMWHVPEAELNVLPEVSGKDVIELGCGTGYWSAWLARRGARPVGIDNSERQLATARALQREHDLEFPLIYGNAEEVPLPDGTFDIAFSEYGASIWCDPYAWIPEAARLLRPGGLLVFLANSVLAMLCAPDVGDVSERLERDQFGLCRLEWPDDDSVNFCLPHGQLIQLLRDTGFAIERLVEVQAHMDSEGTPFWIGAEWAKRWPCEEIWVARKGA
jgi:SAM-dependent methyltransferase